MAPVEPAQPIERGTEVSAAGPVPPGRNLLGRAVVEQIKQYILDRRMRPGDALPTENELCAALGASRSSVREAVKTLAALDIVEVRHGHGTYVGRLSLSALVEGLTFRGLLSPDDDFRVLADLVEIRQLFEQTMAGRIISSLAPAQLDTLDGLVDQMEVAAAGSAPFVDADRAFHTLLVEPVGNELLSQMTSAFWDVYAVVAPHLGVISTDDERLTISSHRDMVGAARADDTTTFVTAVTAHYAPVQRRLAQARDRRPAP